MFAAPYESKRFCIVIILMHLSFGLENFLLSLFNFLPKKMKNFCLKLFTARWKLLINVRRKTFPFRCETFHCFSLKLSSEIRMKKVQKHQVSCDISFSLFTSGISVHFSRVKISSYLCDQRQKLLIQIKI